MAHNKHHGAKDHPEEAESEHSVRHYFIVAKDGKHAGETQSAKQVDPLHNVRHLLGVSDQAPARKAGPHNVFEFLTHNACRLPPQVLSRYYKK